MGAMATFPSCFWSPPPAFLPHDTHCTLTCKPASETTGRGSEQFLPWFQPEMLPTGLCVNTCSPAGGDGFEGCGVLGRWDLTGSCRSLRIGL